MFKFYNLIIYFLIFSPIYSLIAQENREVRSKGQLNWENIKEDSNNEILLWRESEYYQQEVNTKKIGKQRIDRILDVRAMGRSVTINDYVFPEISNYVPNAFVEDWRKTLTVSSRGISATRMCHGKNFSSGCIDGVLDLDFNLINTNSFSFNPKVNIQSLTGRNTSIGEGLSLGFKAAHKFSDKWSFAIGGENIIHFDETIDLGRNFYLVASTFKPLYKSSQKNGPILFLNTGVGTDFYGYKGNGYLGRVNCFGKRTLTGDGTSNCNIGPIGSISIAFNDRFSFNNEWFGYGYGTGFSIRPIKDSSLSLSIYATDYIKGFPEYAKDWCPNKICKTRIYGSISLTF